MENPESYRDILIRQYQYRSEKNPSYTHSAFARDLGLTAAHLSAVFLKKRGISKKTASAIATKLKLNLSECENFIDLCEAEHSRSSLQRQLAKSRLAAKNNLKVHNVQIEIFRSISDWYHFATVELISVKGFKQDPKWISKRLGISLAETRQVIERLFRLGILIEKNGIWEPVEQFIAGPSGVSSEAVRIFHQQMLKKAQLAIHSQPMEKRDLGATALSFNPDELPEARKYLKEFRRNFARKFRLCSNRTALYALTIQFFQLDEPQEA